MTPVQRSKRLEEYCGSSGDIEVSNAIAPGIELSAGPLKIECELTLMNTNLTADLDEYHFPLLGPWVQSVPELTAETRSTPVVFQYARAERTSMEIEVPDLFNDLTIPPPVRLTTPFGRYALDVNPTVGGLHVERFFSLDAVIISADQYTSLRSYLTGVQRADQTMLAFRRSGGAP